MKHILAKTALIALAGTLSATAATLPTAKEVQANMGLGFNIGNSMEVPNDPTGWGNPYPTQDLMDSIKAAGFNTVRIPCAWDSHTSGGKVTETWLDSVKTVVDFAMRAGLYTILNIHHEGEGGWFQSNIGTSVDNTIDNKMKTYWTQIANKFKDYNERLIFAGANEPGPNVNTWTPQHVSTLMHYYQTFIDAVRATGGNNETRTLIIQGLNTDIDKSVASAPVTTSPAPFTARKEEASKPRMLDSYRVGVIVSSRLSPPRSTERTMGEPSGGTSSKYFCMSLPVAMAVPSMAVITSPPCRPASAAAVPSETSLSTALFSSA